VAHEQANQFIKSGFKYEYRVESQAISERPTTKCVVIGWPALQEDPRPSSEIAAAIIKEQKLDYSDDLLIKLETKLKFARYI